MVRTITAQHCGWIACKASRSDCICFESNTRLHNSPDTVQSKTTNNLFRTSPTLFTPPVRGHGTQHQLLSTVLESSRLALLAFSKHSILISLILNWYYDQLMKHTNWNLRSEIWMFKILPDLWFYCVVYWNQWYLYRIFLTNFHRKIE